MNRGWLTVFAHATCAGLLVALLFPIRTLAQQDDIEAAIAESGRGATIRESQALASAEPPKTDDRHELAIFYHKRGMANYRLGNYGRAIEDLRLALENHQPRRPTPDGWGGRWRIQNDLGNAYQSRGDWFSDIDHWHAVAQEYQQTDLFNYHYAQLRLMSAYSVLARWANAERAREEAEATLARLRNTRVWATRGMNALNQHSHYMGNWFSDQGNHLEAERKFRESLEWAEKHLNLRQKELPQGHQSVRIAFGNVGSAKRWLADKLSTLGKYGEAEVFARAGLEDALARYGFNTIAVGYALVVLGWTRFQQGDIAGAEMYYRYAVKAVEGSGVVPHSTALASRRAALANALVAQGWLVRKVAVAQVPSASAFAALRRAPAAKAQRQPFIGFGDPVFTAESVSSGAARRVRSLEVRKVADRTEEQLRVAMRGKGQRAPSVAAEAQPLSRAFGLLSPLPDTSDELKEIAATLKADPSRDVYVNRQATEKNVKQAGLENRRVVAFATHGIAPGEITGLDQPALALSNPALTDDNDNDGFLTMEEVLGLKLDADWVVLSACNTASADGRGSEAVSGLGRAFFYAGARSLLVSNWAVETTSARLLTTELFRRQSEDPALTHAEALRQSMLALMGKNATGATGRTTFSYAHPAFWAPFSLVGDGGR